VSVRSAVIADRDSGLLRRLGGELAHNGVEIEALDSTSGLTPDLLALSAPDFLVLDAELPGLAPAALLVLVRSMKARLPLLQVVVTTEGPVARLERTLAADRVVPRNVLETQGAGALGLASSPPSRVDVRAILDDVLGRSSSPDEPTFDVTLDLFSDHNLWIGGKNREVGLFVATSVLPRVGQTVDVTVHVMGKTTLHFKGEVLWQRPRKSFAGRMPTGIGVRLREASEETKLAMDRFLELREPLMWMV